MSAGYERSAISGGERREGAGLENYWSLLKGALKGTYVNVGPFHLFRYLDEQAFRFNGRKLSDAERFSQVINGIVGKQLMYTDLFGALSAGAPA